MNNVQQAKQDLDNIARLQQMKINTRLTALQAAQTLMSTQGYTGIAGEIKGTGEPAWVKPPGAVDHITLIAIATDIEKYILGDIEQETQDALTAAKMKSNAPQLVRP